MIIWIPVVVNLFLWVINLTCGLGCIYFLLPTFGGWQVLSMEGKIFAVICVLGCLVSGYVLITTSVAPI